MKGELRRLYKASDLTQNDSEKNQDNLNEGDLSANEIDFYELIKLINDLLIAIGLTNKEDKRKYVNKVLGINAKTITELSNDQLIILYHHFNH